MTARKNQLENVNVSDFESISTPADVHRLYPMSPTAKQTVLSGRDEVRGILARHDPRLLVVVGPCSIHDPVAGLEYATRLKKLADALKDTLLIVMRVYFEKPRTTVGWKGYINDPFMDDSFQIDVGLKRAREFLLAVNELGLPTGTEALDPISPQYLGDLISWYAIGARTAESQTHRELSSGLSSPVGFKNGTNGDLMVAVNAILSASNPHSFLGINNKGVVSVVRTSGNRHGHLVLRGGDGKPNYDTVSIAEAEAALRNAKLPCNIIVDCSHANSAKRPDYQPLVLTDIINQIRSGNGSIIGVMIESHLHAGQQKIPGNLSDLKYGISVTDACIDWPTTERMLSEAAEQLHAYLPRRITIA